jgi:hypothetical protein
MALVMTAIVRAQSHRLLIVGINIIRRLFVFRLRIVRIGLGCRMPKHGIDSSLGAFGTVLDAVGEVCS